MFAREDWTLFRNLNTLSQKAGVPVTQIRRLVVKELVDNAYDSGGTVTFGKTGENSYWVEDTGSGIPGTPDEIASLFSIRRPLTSTKILRKPSRGALGNGLRVVVGAVLSSGGTIEVTTRGVRHELRPMDDGTTKLVSISTEPRVQGTRIVVVLRDGVPTDRADMALANLTKAFAVESVYKGRTSAWWYDSDSFFELLQSGGTLKVEELVGLFEGFGTRSGEALVATVAAEPIRSAGCQELTREQGEELLKNMRAKTKPVPSTKIGHVGGAWKALSYAKAVGTLSIKPGRGSTTAELPYMIEACATRRDDQEQKDVIFVFVNGTPIIEEVTVDRLKPTHVAVHGCGLGHRIEKVSTQKFQIVLNVTTPYMPLTNDGKKPDLSKYVADIAGVMGKTTRRLKSNIKKAENRGSQTDVILRHLRDSMRQASGGGKYRYSLRQLYYAVRPHLLAGGYPQVNYNHFCAVISEYESKHGDLKGMYRDPRGTLYHPHLRKDIPLGTLAVEEYERPPWTFNKVLYCEKEGFTHLLKSVGWPERNDCALLSSKGFASRAVRDVIDLLGDTEEEVTFYCIHDADASGTLIYQSLQDATTARAARRVKIVNLGLDPWEAVGMGLQVEEFTTKGERDMPVADYVKNYYDDDPPADSGATSWRRWLQGRRVELNSMSSPQFLEWLDEKLLPYNKGKVVPPEYVLQEQLAKNVEAVVRQKEAEAILLAAGFESRVRSRVAAVHERAGDQPLHESVRGRLGVNPERRWLDPVREAAEELVDNHS